MLSGDVKINPRLLSNCKEYFSICHCNLNSNINDNGNGLLATSTLHVLHAVNKNNTHIYTLLTIKSYFKKQT